MRALFHAHSTPFGIAASALLAAVAGAFTGWSAPAMLIVFFVLIFVLPRAFYGWAAAKAVDAERVQDDSEHNFPSRFDGAGLGRHAMELEDAYDEARDGGLLPSGLPRDPQALQKFATEEERS
jgi:hypothetical protein